MHKTISYINQTLQRNAGIPVLLMLCCIFSNAFVYAKDNLRSTVEKQMNSSALKHAQWSIYAEYADTGKEIISYDSDKSLAPASNLKVITTGIALIVLRETFQFTTSLYYDGEISDTGTLQGNLYVKGEGDPTLGSAKVKGSPDLDKLMHQWITAIKKKGIRQIEGNVIADVSLFDEQSVPDFWPWSDIGNYFAAGTSALCIHDNLYYLYFKPGRRVGDKAEVTRIKPKIPDLVFDNHMRTGKPGSGDNGFIYCAPKQFTATLRGTIPAGVKEFAIKGSIPDPPLFATHYLMEFLAKEGIKVTGSAIVTYNRQELHEENRICTTLSPILSDIIATTNKESVNLYAEQLLKVIAVRETGVGSTKNGVSTIESVMKSLGINMEGFSIFDGCGLSRNNLVTTQIMGMFLSAMTSEKCFDAFYHSLSLAGDAKDAGYVKQFGAGTSIALNARIKTGYINGVRAHSGYIRSQSGRLISFSLICNNFSSSLSAIDKIHESVLVQLARLP
ncbi:MAG: D-alanyl-D-alanine carboxypeptidase/D-alanyl-D-alanine-endopeptidase [Candidatus Kuenenia sp.]|nr:D-alanyl-D-alanine carboxypeptidase/D-alanyl-D-alanine-endopeptidase [Candidatus Kuenenia hertensis]